MIRDIALTILLTAFLWMAGAGAYALLVIPYGLYMVLTGAQLGVDAARLAVMNTLLDARAARSANAVTTKE